MNSLNNPLQWINEQHLSMISLLETWVNINSGSENLDGLARMLAVITGSFSKLGAEINIVDLPSRTTIDNHGKLIIIPSAQALHLRKRPDAPIQVFLCGHMDTVYSPSHPFQIAERIGPNLMKGPGVTDMKGGLVILLKTLEAFEQSPLAHNLGWEVVINPDEEIGSVGSEKLIAECAARNTLGLIFEPSFADGTLVDSRKGSANITIVAHGKSAHAGRDFDKGCNALTAIAAFAVEADKLNDPQRGISVNIAHISGGGPLNIVPDLGICRINTRAKTIEDFKHVQMKLRQLADSPQPRGVTLEFHLGHAKKPKIFDEKSQQLADNLKSCAQEEGYELHFKPSGGTSDGNTVAEHGLPVIDTLGVIGGDIHTANEYALLDSLVSRTRLVTLLLLKLASGALK